MDNERLIRAQKAIRAWMTGPRDGTPTNGDILNVFGVFVSVLMKKPHECSFCGTELMSGDAPSCSKCIEEHTCSTCNVLFTGSKLGLCDKCDRPVCIGCRQYETCRACREAKDRVLNPDGWVWFVDPCGDAVTRMQAKYLGKCRPMTLNEAFRTGAIVRLEFEDGTYLEGEYNKMPTNEGLRLIKPAGSPT